MLIISSIVAPTCVIIGSSAVPHPEFVTHRPETEDNVTQLHRHPSILFVFLASVLQSDSARARQYTVYTWGSLSIEQ